MADRSASTIAMLLVHWHFQLCSHHYSYLAIWSACRASDYYHINKQLTSDSYDSSSWHGGKTPSKCRPSFYPLHVITECGTTLCQESEIPCHTSLLAEKILASCIIMQSCASSTISNNDNMRMTWPPIARNCIICIILAP